MAILMVGAFVYKSMFLSDTIEDTKKIVTQSMEYNSKFNRDVSVQSHIDSIKSVYSYNTRGESSFGDIIVRLLSTIEEILKSTGINYDDNDIKQSTEEKYDYKNGTVTYTISLNFRTDYQKLKNFISALERNRQVINISSLKILRSKQELGQLSSQFGKKEGEEFDEFNVKPGLDCFIDLEFVKYL